MENFAPHGPAPVRATDGAGALSVQRAKVLESLQGRDGAVTATGLAGELGLHVNTVREHLDELVARSLAVREQAPAAGRGRPAWTYRAAPLTEHDPRVREYAGLATALAGHIARTSPDPAADAVAAGIAWGRELMAREPAGGEPAGREPVGGEPVGGEPVGGEPVGGEPVGREPVGGGTPSPPPRGSADPSRTARRRVVELLDQLGFAPAAERQGHRVALRRCPLLDAARRHPHVVCGVHLGLVRGALEALGADADQAELQPFAEPGACRLTLTPGS